MYIIYSKGKNRNIRMYTDYLSAIATEGVRIPSATRSILKVAGNLSGKAIWKKFVKRIKDNEKKVLTKADRDEFLNAYQQCFGTPLDGMDDEEGGITRLHLYLPNDITIYTDGSYIQMDDGCGVGGYAAIFLASGRPIASLAGSGTFGSSMEAEWKAIDAALSAVSGRGHRVYVYTDCEQIVFALYKAVEVDPNANPEIANILDFCSRNTVSFHHVSGHSGFDGSEWNELVDALAHHEAEKKKVECG